MKKTIQLAGVLTLILALFTLNTAFTSANMSSDSDNTCTVTVYNSDGSKAQYVKVSTDVSGGISCIGGRDFTTDKNGVVTVKWSKGCYLKKVYVKGKGYDVDYQNGKSYTLTIK